MIRSEFLHRDPCLVGCDDECLVVEMLYLENGRRGVDAPRCELVGAVGKFERQPSVGFVVGHVGGGLHSRVGEVGRVEIEAVEEVVWLADGVVVEVFHCDHAPLSVEIAVDAAFAA